jgi:hypothetical protein
MGFECTNRAMALTALDTIAAGSMKGPQRDAVMAVKAWVQENTSTGLTDEVEEAIRKALAAPLDDLLWEIERADLDSAGALEIVEVLKRRGLIQP